ncbi:SRPBCC family protein [Actinopolymorpha pittospori]|uniref:Membrane protein n=1 Tax=Actinopolymorpha pittospori TaxID=648752 RepID=A0A927MUJ0_9ACTN|nr:SRPBCC family protein [Actinopolymorpha pittospori]MBE1607160.1 putative membrane protein [Actinopolymorpha pittospori]
MTDKGVSALSNVGSALLRSPAAERLAKEARDYALARGDDLVRSASERLEQTTQRLEDHADNPGALGVGLKKLAEGKSPLHAGASAAVTGVKDKVKSLFGKGSSGKPKMTNIIEDIDVGAPVSVVYDQWTQFQEFSSFMKGVESIDQRDEVESNWRGKVWWSHRSWKATVTEQIPDRKIAWTSEGAKGTTKGVVTFHPLADDLTKVLLVLEYYPGGLVEKTANLWRAFGRRVRLDLKHFRRFVSMRGEATGSWRGEIEDGQVVRQPDEVEQDGVEDTDDLDDTDDFDDDGSEFEDSSDDIDSDDEDDDLEDEDEDDEDTDLDDDLDDDDLEDEYDEEEDGDDLEDDDDSEDDDSDSEDDDEPEFEDDEDPAEDTSPRSRNGRRRSGARSAPQGRKGSRRGGSAAR